jgi:hypothetical protein
LHELGLYKLFKLFSLKFSALSKDIVPLLIISDKVDRMRSAAFNSQIELSKAALTAAVGESSNIGDRRLVSCLTW